MDSVQYWAALHGFDYQFIDDVLFDSLSAEILQKTRNQRVIATDLARLKALQQALTQGYETVIWCDADFLVFAPQQLQLPIDNFAVGREVWVQQATSTDKKSSSDYSLKAYVKVHNAFLLFRQGNTFLDFYAETAGRLILANTGSMPAQFIGPKLLTALHNIIQCPVIETAGMLSPLVIKDIIHGGGAALDLFRRRSTQPIAAANLCSSSLASGELNVSELEQVIRILQVG